MTDQLIRLYRPMPVGSNPNDKPDLVIDGNPYVQILAVAPEHLGDNLELECVAEWPGGKRFRLIPLP